jgi:hypothetical protein
MKHRFVLVFIVLFLVSCQKRESNPVVVTSPKTTSLKTADLYSKVYYISTSLDTEKCIAYNIGCDCCDGKIVFLKGNRFISDNYCIPEEYYTTGTFEIKKDKLLLKYSKKQAILGPLDDSDYEAKDTLRLETIPYDSLVLSIFRCQNKSLFKNKNEYYSEDTKTLVSEAIDDYKKKGVWEILGLKD